jgi:hypothetical protein
MHYPNTAEAEGIGAIATYVLFGALPIIVVVAFLWYRAKTQKGIGVRAIQMISLVLILPLIGTLAMHQALPKDAVGPLLGAIIGYVLSGIAKKEDKAE